MRIKHTLAIVLGALACIPAFAQMPGHADQADMVLTAPARQQVIDNLIREIHSSYVFPETAARASAALREQQRRGTYDGITSANRLSQVLTSELQALAKDRHLSVLYSEVAIPEKRPHGQIAPEERARRLAVLREENFGVEKIERLPFNIGYLELTRFAPARDAADTIAAAMTVLAHTDALIIDLRKNTGGDLASAVLLASYLFDKRTHLYDFHHRKDNRFEQTWTSDVVPGLRYGEKRAVYVLTSKETFSAAEYFSDALKNLKRGTIIGETTGGGANAGDIIRLAPNFAAFVPLSRSVSPLTKTNWEGVGVTPDITVTADDALNAAQLAILGKMAASENDASRLERLKDRLASIRSASRISDAGR